mgnify:FL=1
MTESRALANQERDFQVRRLNKLGRTLLVMLAGVLSCLTLALLAVDQLFHPQAFVINELQIKGKFRYLDVADVDSVLRKQTLGNFFSVELNQLKKQVEALEWVESADIRRQWPNSLSVTVVEHKPAMRWGADKWVSTSGAIINLPIAVVSKKVVTLSGAESQSKQILLQAANWQEMFANDGLELRKAKLSSSQAWILNLYYAELDSEFDLLLGSDDLVERLARFKTLFTEKLMFSEYKLKRVDARYPDGLAVLYSKKRINRRDGQVANNEPLLAITTAAMRQHTFNLNN